MGTDKKEESKGMGGDSGAKLSLVTSFSLSVPIRVIRGCFFFSVSLWFSFFRPPYRNGGLTTLALFIPDVVPVGTIKGDGLRRCRLVPLLLQGRF